MAYSAISFSALEQPTLAKWNILGTNDAYFNTQVGANFSSGTTSTVWWEELGRTTLSGAGDTISVTPIAARNFLRIQFHAVSTGGTIAPVIRFNNDTATNYAFMYAANLGGIVNSVSQTYLDAAPSIAAGTYMGCFDVTNFTSQRKLYSGNALDDNNGNATTSANNHQIYGKWDNTSAQITRVDLVNIGAGDFAIGSKIIILGHD